MDLNFEAVISLDLWSALEVVGKGEEETIKVECSSEYSCTYLF